MNLFSKNLRYLRKIGNHNQEEISALFNKRPNTVGNWENQKSEPSLAELIKLGAFFKVSEQDLLHRDFEKSGLGQTASQPGVNAYSVSPANSFVQEPDHDTFWIILKELRQVNEKLDRLVAGMESSGFKSGSDKSYH